MTFEERLAAVELAVAANQLPASLAALQRKLEADWQPEASVLLQPGSVTSELLPFQFAFGNMSSGGTFTNAFGCTAVRNAVGDYTITFAPAFKAAPSVGMFAGKKEAEITLKTFGTTDITATGFRVAAISDAIALIDDDFSFIAIGAR